MKNWMKSTLMAFFLVAAISVTALAAGFGSGRLTAKENDVAVSINIPEGKTETITSLRVKLHVALNSGSMKEPAFQFENTIKSAVKDAAISREANGSYMVDLILSGKKDQAIFGKAEDVSVGTLSIRPDSEEYEIKVEFAGIHAKSEQPDVSYVKADGTSELSVLLSDAESVVLKKAKTEPTEQPTEPTEQPTEPTEQPTEPTEQPTEPSTEQPIVNPPVPEPVAPRAPELKAAAKTGSKAVMFTWTKIDEADGYVLYEYNSSMKKFMEIQTLASPSITAYSQSFANATAHRFKICAYKVKQDGTRLYSADSAEVNVKICPAKVKGITAKFKNDSKVTIAWKKVSGAKGYQIYRSKKKNGKYTLVKTIKKGGTKKCNLSHKAGKTYYYKVRAFVTDVNGKRVYGTFSAVKSPKKKS